MSKERAAPHRDIHAEITNQLVAAIEANPGNFALPWRKSAGALHIPVNALTGKLYNGINVVSLWVAAEVLGYATPIWGTYRQWAERGAQVRKGEIPIPTLRMPMTTANVVLPAPPTCSMPARSTASRVRPRWSLWVRSRGRRAPIASLQRPERGSSMAVIRRTSALRPITSRCPTRACSPVAKA